MASSVGKSTLQPGRGELQIRVLPPSTFTISALAFTYPLKLISPPSTPSARCVLVFMLTYGGGLVAGDSVDLHVDVCPGARLALVTQGSTKIYKSPSRDVRTTQCLTARVEAGAALLLLPDPVQPFKDCVYEQRQVFNIDPVSSNLLVLDWVSEGRTARGERWDFWEWKGRNTFRAFPEYGTTEKPNGKGRLLLRDYNFLEGAPPYSAENQHNRMDNLAVFGTLIIRGRLFQDLAQFFLKEFSNQPRIGERSWSAETPHLSDEEHKRQARRLRGADAGLLWTAVSVRGFVLVKFGARDLDGARRWLREMLMEEGTVEREFGERCLLCLR